MLDIMEMRGFLVTEPHDRREPLYLVTPDGYHFAVQIFPNHSNIQCAFAAFETLNTHYK